MARNGTNRSTIQQLARLFGIVFLVVGVAGFIPGLTTDYDRLGTFGDVAAKVLGVFGVNWLENVAHLAFGVAGLALARRADTARQYFLVSGVLYMGLWLYGMATDEHSDANFLGVNDAGNWLHFTLGVAMLAIGALVDRDRRGAARTA